MSRYVVQFSSGGIRLADAQHGMFLHHLVALGQQARVKTYATPEEARADNSYAGEFHGRVEPLSWLLTQDVEQCRTIARRTITAQITSWSFGNGGLSPKSAAAVARKLAELRQQLTEIERAALPTTQLCDACVGGFARDVEDVR